MLRKLKYIFLIAVALFSLGLLVRGVMIHRRSK